MDLAFHALADPNRRAIVELLALRPFTVNELLEHFDFSQPALSKHLRVLRDGGLVAAQNEGRFRHYSLSGALLGELAEWLLQSQRQWDERLDRLGEVLDDAARRGRKPR